MPPFQIQPITRMLQQRPLADTSGLRQIGQLLLQKQKLKLERDMFEAQAPLREAQAAQAQSKAAVAQLRASEVTEQDLISRVFSSVARAPEPARNQMWQRGVQFLEQKGVNVQGLPDEAPPPDVLTRQAAASRAKVGELLHPTKSAAKIQQALERANSRFGTSLSLPEMQTLHPGVIKTELDRLDTLAHSRAAASAARVSFGNRMPPTRVTENREQQMLAQTARRQADIASIKDLLSEGGDPFGRLKSFAGKIPQEALKAARTLDDWAVLDTVEDATRIGEEAASAAADLLQDTFPSAAAQVRELAKEAQLATTAGIDAIREWQDWVETVGIRIRKFRAGERHDLYGSALTSFEIIEARKELLNDKLTPIQFMAAVSEYERILERDRSIAQELLGLGIPLDSAEWKMSFEARRDELRIQERKAARERKRAMKEGRIEKTPLILAMVNRALRPLQPDIAEGAQARQTPSRRQPQDEALDLMRDEE